MSAPDPVAVVLDAARAAGCEAEVLLSESRGLEVRVQKGEVDHLERAHDRGLGVRVVEAGRVGYAYTESFEGADLASALEKARAASAYATPDEAVGLASAPELAEGACAPFDEELARAEATQFVKLALEVERVAREAETRIMAVPHAACSTHENTVRVASTRGLDRAYRTNGASVYAQALAAEGNERKSGLGYRLARRLDELDAEAAGREAAARATELLGATEPASGRGAVAFHPEAAAQLLGAFSSMFSAKAAQEGRSLLAGREGEAIAAACVRVIDDPCRPDGFAARPFDAEGWPSAQLALVDAGRFASFLHNSETARRALARSTGHASRSYSGALGVGPTNLLLAPGEATREKVLARFERCIELTDLQGVHSGANAASGEFSLQAQGFLVERGARVRPVHNFTVAGSFLEMLSRVAAVADDFKFSHFPVGAPTVLVSELAVAGGGS